jgi:hypothetical protein
MPGRHRWNPQAERSKAYQSEDFIHSVEARPVRILAEYAEPLARFQRHGVIDTMVFMGSARFLSREAAEAQIAAVLQQSSDEADIRMAEQALANATYTKRPGDLHSGLPLGRRRRSHSGILSAPVADQGSWKQQTEVQPKPTGSASG